MIDCLDHPNTVYRKEILFPSMSCYHFQSFSVYAVKVASLCNSIKYLPTASCQRGNGLKPAICRIIDSTKISTPNLFR